MRHLACLIVIACSSSDPSSSRTVTLSMDPFTVAPGEEVWKCQTFADPFGDIDTAVQRWHATLPEGAHHLLVSEGNASEIGPLRDCGAPNLNGQIFDGQSLDTETTYPDGVGYLLPGSTPIRVEVHYLDTGTAELTGGATIEATDVGGDDAIESAGPLLFTTTTFEIPPRAEPTTATKTCAVERDIFLIDAVSHMHRHGTHFEARLGDTVLYETDEYSHPPRRHYDTPIALHAGDEITFACTWMNDGPTTLVFGDSADTDEMCALFGTWYPVPEGTDPFLTCGLADGPPLSP